MAPKVKTNFLESMLMALMRLVLWWMYVKRLTKSLMNSSIGNHHIKTFLHELPDTLKGWKTPEVPTGPETSPVDTTPLPIFFITRCHIEHHFMYPYWISLCYCPLGYSTTVSEYVGTHT